MAFNLNDDKGKKIRIPCRECNVKTLHEVMCSLTERVHSPDYDYQAEHEYQILTCCGCETVAFRHNYTDTEDMVYDEESNGFVSIDHEKLYPSRLVGRKPLEHQYNLPVQIRKIYVETTEALTSDQHILAGIGIRALLEATCNELGAKGRNLAARIDSLVAQNQVTQGSADLLHATRLLGNVAAHEVKPQPIDDLTAAFDVVEHLLQTAYILPEKARLLAKRYPKAKASKQPSARSRKKPT